MPIRSVLPGKALRFPDDDSGSGGVLPIFMLIAILALGGVASDLASLWRQSEVMRATADTAAHSGVVALARGHSAEDALAVAETAIGLNMNPEIFGPAINKPRSDLVRTWHYDATTGALSEDGPANAVSVQIRRSRHDGNPLPTYLLGLIGLGDIVSSTTAVVALAPTAACSNVSGVFARKGLLLAGPAEVGSGYCLHSQSGIEIAQPAKFAPGASLSLPDMADCAGFCGREESPGLRAAASEANLISAPLLAQFSDVMTEMLGPVEASDRKRDFFASRPISRDLEPIAEVGRSTSGLQTGSVVRLPKAEFEKMRDYPQGLVYVVTCDKKSSGADQVLQVGGIVGAPRLADAVLLTSCALHFRAGFQVTGALILSTFEGADPSITADPEAVLGDIAGKCQPSAQSVVMALGDQALPAGLTGSNAAFLIDGSATMLPDEDTGHARHVGFALHASGTAGFPGKHEFSACGGTSSTILPQLNVIRFVMPRIPAQPLFPRNDAEMPGEKVKPLPSTPPLPMAGAPQALPAEILSQADLPGSRVGL